MLFLRRIAVIIAVTFFFMSSALAGSNSQSAIAAQDYFRSGVTALEQGSYHTAIEEFTQAIEQNPHAAAYSNRCLVYLLLDQPQQALADCTQAIQHNPTNGEPYLNRGLAQYRLGNYQEAIANYNQLLGLQPQDFRAYYNRGLGQFALRNYAEAIADYNFSLASPLVSASQLAEIYDDRGIAFLMLGNYQQALADFTQTIQFIPTDTRAFFNRACAYHQQENYLAALNDFDRVLELAPHNAQAYFNRGLLRHQMGDRPDAITDLQQAARHFYHQGLLTSYQQSLNLLQQIHPRSVIG